MRLASFTDFGLRVLVVLAGDPARSFTTNEIARSFGISRHHLTKVVGALAEAGFVSPSAVPREGFGSRARSRRSGSARSCGCSRRVSPWWNASGRMAEPAG